MKSWTRQIFNLRDLIQAYVEGAMASVEETFTESHLDKEYHYTLYYYDRAGNLIETESGAIVTDFAGGHDFFKSGNSVAASPRVLKDMLAKIRPNLTESLAK